MAAPIIEIKGVSKRYQLGSIGLTSLRDEFQRVWDRTRRRASVVSEKEFWALREVSFDVQPGKVLGIIGRNGAGKSTLLKVLSRITTPTSGEVHVHGRVASLLEVGTGFQPDLTGRENVFLNGAILGMSRAEIRAKFDEIVAFAEVGKFIDTPVKRYSSGMYVRLAFAVAAHLEPEILIIDEVLAVGDQAFQQKCLGKMQDVAHNSGRTILFVSHHMTAIRRLCDSCVVLSNGRASEVLDVDTAVHHYNEHYHQDQSAHRVDTSQLPREHGKGTDARIIQVEALGENPLVYGNAVRIAITIQVNRPIDAVMVGMGFDSTEGGRVLTIDSDTSASPFSLPVGIHEVTLSLDQLALHPTQYVVHVAIGSGGHYFDILGRCALWEVATGPADKISDRGFGGCRVQPNVSIRHNLRGRQESIPALP